MQAAVQDRTASLIARAQTLQIEITAVWFVSCALLERSRRRQLTSSYPGLRSICGASDVALIEAAIADVPLCLHCIAQKSGLPVEEVNPLITTLARTVVIRIGPNRCDACLEPRITFSAPKDRQP